jgi:hypothetical protein
MSIIKEYRSSEKSKIILDRRQSTHRVENIFPKYLLYYVHEIARNSEGEEEIL